MYIRDDALKKLRQLAKSNYYQNLYYHVREHGFRLFHNEHDMTELQMFFLNYLDFYSTLHLDLAMGDIDEIVFDNEIFEDAYYAYRTKARKERNDKPQDKGGGPHVKSKWIFKSKPKGNLNSAR